MLAHAMRCGWLRDSVGAHLRGGAPRLLPQLIEVAAVLPQHDLGVVHKVRGRTLVCRRYTHARTAGGSKAVSDQLNVGMRRLSCSMLWVMISPPVLS